MADDPFNSVTEEMLFPPVVYTHVERIIQRGLARGQEYYDEVGRRLLTLEAICAVLAQTGIIYGPPRKRQPLFVVQSPDVLPAMNATPPVDRCELDHMDRVLRARAPKV